MSAPRRVLMLAPSFAPRRGGVEKHVLRVSRELVAAGLEVRVATPRWDEGWPVEEEVEGLPVLRLSRDRRTGSRALGEWVRWAEVVHTHDAYPFLKYYLPYRLRRRRPPTVVTFHGYEAYPVPLEARILRRLVLWLTHEQICAGAFIPKWYHFHCDHITHGAVDAPPELPAGGNGAVFVGRLDADTGLLTYLEGLVRLRERHQVNLPLRVIGDGPARKDAEQRALQARLEVEFVGQVEDVAPALRAAKFALVSGLLSMLEAMAYGAAVLAVYDNPLKEDYLRLFPGARHIAIAGSADELADDIAELLACPETLERTLSAAYAFAREQTWERLAQLYLRVYARLPLGDR